jgi:hypothetical protein
MLSIKDSKVVLTQMGLTEEQINLYEKSVEPFIVFHKFVMESNDISSEAAEKLADSYVKEYFNDYIKNNNNLEDINELELAGEAMKSFAIVQNYDKVKSEELVVSTHNIMKLFENVFDK